MKTLSFFKIGFFVLVALNLVLIFLMVRPHGPHKGGPPSMDRIVERLEKVLSLDAKQKQELKIIFEQHQNQKDSMFRNSDLIREQMMICLTNGNNCDSLWKTSANSANFEKSMFDHHRRILSILRDDQKKIYLEELKTRKHGGQKGPRHF